MEKLPSLADEELRDKYDLVFIGGGPSTLSFFSFMCRNKNFENFFKTLNVLIIEKSETFGSGCLGKYGINSNTSAEGFVRLICFNDDENGKEEKQNLSPNKKKVNETSKNNFYNNKENSNNSNSNSKTNFNASATNFTNSTIFQKFKNKVVPVFEELLHSNETKNLINIGSKIAPLSMIGNFLDCVGNALTYYIYNKFHKKILMNHCEVLKINVDQDKCFETDNLKIKDLHNSKDYPYEIFIEKRLKHFNNNYQNSNNTYTNNNNCREINEIIKHYTLKSKLVVMASGAQQKFDDKLKQEILKQLSPSDFFHSDYVLQENGFNHLINNLKLKEKKRVVIIGGSHSGFSCAWLLLNGYIDIQKLKEQNKSIRLSSAFSNNNNNNHYLNEKNISQNPTGASYRCKINRNCSDCRTFHCCFGSVTDRSWNKSKSINSHIPIAAGNYFNMDNLEIHILYRDHIRVYYHSEREAFNDGYNVFDQSKAVNKNGNVYPFIGIRGDAKELYRKIIIGKEKRVKLIKCNNSNEQIDQFSKANVVIWACGYTSQKMNFFDSKHKNKEIEFYLDSNNQFDVDKELHLLNKKKSPFLNLFGIGQGYSTHSIEVLSNGKYARADSVNLYNTYISKKLFRALDLIFNFTGENLNNLNNNTKGDKEKEKENLKKTSNLNKNNQGNNIHNQNQQSQNIKKNMNDANNLNNNITTLKQQYANYSSNMTNNYHNENYGNNNNKNREAHKENNSNNKVIRLIQNENSNNLRNSNNLAHGNSTNNNINKNNNLVSSSNLLSHSNSQNFYNSPNLKTVKLMSNNLTNINNANTILDSKKSTTKNAILVNPVYQGNVNNNTNNNNNFNDHYNNKVPSINNNNNNYNSDLNLPNNDLSKSEINILDSKKNKKISTNTILRANVSRGGVKKYGNSSKNNFFKNPLNNESQIEFSQILNYNINNNNNNNNILQNGNLKGEFSPPSRSMNIRNSINDQLSESNSINRNFPIKRDSSMIKSLHQNQNNMNISNKNNYNNNNINSPNLVGNSKSSTINKNFSNLNNLVNNNLNINQGSHIYNNNSNNVLNNNHSIINGQSSLTPNIYTSKNIIISRDYVSKSPKTSNVNTNFINSNQNIDAFKSSYKDFNLKEKNLMNSNHLRKGNINEIHRNQVYFGKTQNNANLKNANINSNNHHEQNIYHNSTEKYNDMNNKNNIGSHNKYPSFNSPIIEKPLLRYQISPITNANKGKSKYILYDSTKNFIGNMNSMGMSNSHNFNYHLNSSNFTSKMGKN